MATKAEMINEVAESAGVSKTDAEATVGAFFDLRAWALLARDA